MKPAKSIIVMLFAVISCTLVVGQATQVKLAYAVHGELIFNYNGSEKLLNMDTFTGEIQILVDGGPFVTSPRLSPSGEALAYFYSVSNVRENFILNLNTGVQHPISAYQGRNTVTYPAGWSDKGEYLYFLTWKAVVGGSRSYIVERYDVNHGTFSTLREFELYERLILNTDAFLLQDIRGILPNPVYGEWIALLAEGMFSNVVSDPSDTEADIILWNYQTGELISMGSLLDDIDLSFQVSWNDHGNSLLVQTYTDKGNIVNLIKFEPKNADQPIELTKSFPMNQDQTVLSWLGVEDILISFGKDAQTDDRVFYLGQSIGELWYSTEFFRLAVDPLSIPYSVEDWQITAGIEEQNKISCLFDQNLKARLNLNGRGRVTIADSFPVRLRSAPGLDSSVVIEMPAGTEFQVIGSSMCVDGYRWWQIQLDDGTTGYAAEAGTTEYFLEPLAITATDESVTP